ncbi:uncharacterized protein B0H18DRAFT_1125258 [Fomitopsis serialis]|uniref:uncharacterized protein n=1 Tax=Fomitopsis serialis TaxID=139415 RepID=UPI002007C6DE|nr:uncharacterized protein B0H18DRAFT_1125258 [Neoantrodia serialis]KAH9914822.1 hypothetical protein B0H18DRAFT_1125258 [Neoantrodia serialis]
MDEDQHNLAAPDSSSNRADRLATRQEDGDTPTRVSCSLETRVPFPGVSGAMPEPAFNMSEHVGHTVEHNATGPQTPLLQARGSAQCPALPAHRQQAATLPVLCDDVAAPHAAVPLSRAQSELWEGGRTRVAMATWPAAVSLDAVQAALTDACGNAVHASRGCSAPAVPTLHTAVGHALLPPTAVLHPPAAGPLTVGGAELRDWLVQLGILRAAAESSTSAAIGESSGHAPVTAGNKLPPPPYLPPPVRQESNVGHFDSFVVAWKTLSHEQGEVFVWFIVIPVDNEGQRDMIQVYLQEAFEEEQDIRGVEQEQEIE